MSRFFLFLSIGILLLLSACAAETEPAAGLPTDTPPPTVITATSEPTLAPTAVPSPTTIPSPTVVPSPTPVPSPTLPADTTLITAEPLFSGPDLRFVQWSPDDRYLAYFEYTAEQAAQSETPQIPGTFPGTFTIYDAETDEKCQAYDLGGYYWYEGPGPAQQIAWLANGDFLVILPDGQMLLSDRPCGEAQPLHMRFPEQIKGLENTSPSGRYLLLLGTTAYWLYEIGTDNIYPLPEIEPDAFNNLAWSPNETYLAVNLAGAYADGMDPMGGTRIIDIATGEIITRHDWMPENALDGSFGGPVWIDEETLLITLSRDQGPFFLTVAGAVESVLPLFGLRLEDGVIVQVNVALDAENGVYHLLLTDYYTESGDRQPSLLYHSETGEVETISASFPYLSADNRIVSDTSARPLDPIAAPFEALSSYSCLPSWYAPDSPVTAGEAAGGYVVIRTVPECKLVERYLFDAYRQGYFIFPYISPNGKRVAVDINDQPSQKEHRLMILTLASD